MVSVRHSDHLTKLIPKGPAHFLRLELEQEVMYLGPNGHDTKVNLRWVILAIKLGKNDVVALVVPWQGFENKTLVSLSAKVEDKPPVLAGHLLNGDCTLQSPHQDSEFVDEDSRIHLEGRQAAPNHQEPADGLSCGLHIDDERGTLSPDAPQHHLPFAWCRKQRRGGRRRSLPCQVNTKHGHVFPKKGERLTFEKHFTSYNRYEAVV